MLKDSYYEEKVFPLVDQQKDKFNWWAAFLGFYWFPYKGLWKMWLIYEVLLNFPLTFLMVLEWPQHPIISMVSKILSILLCAFLVVYLGNVSSVIYQKNYNSIIQKNSTARGIVGTVVAVIAAIVSSLVGEGLVQILKRSLESF